VREQTNTCGRRNGQRIEKHGAAGRLFISLAEPHGRSSTGAFADVFLVSAEGFGSDTRGSGHSCQMAFSDDPRMTPHWQYWASKLRFPVLRLQRDAAGILKANYDVTLRKEAER